MGVISEYTDNDVYMHYSKSDENELNYQGFKAHIHDKYELYYFILGDCTMRIESNSVKLSPGTALLIPPGITHTLKIDGDVTYERIACHFSQNKSLNPGLYNNFLVWNDRNNFIYECLMSIMEDENKADAVSIYLPAVIHKITKANVSSSIIDISNDDIIDKIITYINYNLTQDINLDTIASNFFISKAHMCRKFKKHLGISVWEFISKKRIILAQQKIYSHNSIQKGFEISGFGDYSSFYKQYVKQFGISPQNDLKQHNKTAKKA